MAIKIIKNTMVDPIEVECQKCFSIFSFNYEDIETETNSALGMKIVVKYVICPVCKSKVQITRNREGNVRKADDRATEGNNNQ